MKRSGRFFMLVALAGLVVLGIPIAALATSFGIQVVGPGQNVIIMDNMPGDLDLNPNVMIVSVATPAFTVSIHTALTNTPGDASGAVVDLGWQVKAGTGGQLVVTASATGFTVPPAGQHTTLVSSFGGTISAGGGTATAQQWANPSDIIFDTTGSTPGPQGPFPPLAFASVATADFTSAIPYSITDRLTLDLNPAGQSSGDLNSTVGKVPEPMSLILLGGGLAGAGLYRRLRKPKG